MNRKITYHNPNKQLLLYTYFIVIIAIGMLLLLLPMSWTGDLKLQEVSIIDALFTAVSATCVTGLATLDTSLWSRFGQVVILVMIQAGGLGIITFGMLYLALPKMRVPLKSTKMLQSGLSTEPLDDSRVIVRNVIISTLLIEGIGFLILLLRFGKLGISSPAFAALFHAISAFCNAGFSLFDDSLIRFRNDIVLNITIMLLIIFGGMGFMVIRDIKRKIQNKHSSLHFHTRIMLIGIPLFIIIGFLGYFILGNTGAFAEFPLRERIWASLFQSVSTRTAGFNTIEQSALSPPSRWLTLALMLIGGGSGSTAGGIKVSTAFILIIVLFRGINERGSIRFLNRNIDAVDVSKAAMFFIKAIAILFISILALSIFENPVEKGFSSSDLIFECVSALGTVGLSTGITAQLSIGGKIIIMLTMFTGRVGLFALVIQTFHDRVEHLIDYPRGEVLIG